jgi:hypothetical protein
VVVVAAILVLMYRWRTRWERYYRRYDAAAREDMRNFRKGMSWEEAHRARSKVREPRM